MSTALSEARIAARVRIVDEHMASENSHNLEGIMATYGATGFYHDAPWNDRREGRGGVQSYYVELLSAVPDFHADVTQRHVSGDSIVLEVVIRGTHLGPWRGLPATGRRLEIPLCAIFTFGDDDKIAGEKIYYDRATVLHQLGVFFEPDSLLGKLTTMLTHPVTMTRAIGRGIFQR
jgi:steroid delta-isomerase-like uncharacterized protein